MVICCVAKGCENKQRTYTNTMFHRIPKSVERRSLWLAALGISSMTPEDKINQYRVCQEHFKPEDYEKKMHYASRKMVLTLKNTAVPSVFDTEAERSASSMPAYSELLLPQLENTDIDMGQEEDVEAQEEEVEEEVEEKDEEEEEEQEGKRKPKRKKKNSDDEWAPGFEEVAETSGEESEGSEEEEGPYPLVWCHECAEEAGVHCFKQKHPQLYCCVQCGYREGYQEAKNTDGQDTQIIGSPETARAGHQEGETGHVNQADESSCSAEADDGDKLTAFSDCPADPNSITSQRVINCDALHRNRHNNQAAASNNVRELIQNGDSSHGACGIIEQGSSVGSSHQGVTRTEIPEDKSSSGKDSNTSQLGLTSSHHKEANAVNLEKGNIPKYAVYFIDVDSLQCHMKESHGHKRELCPDCGKFLYRYKGKSSHICEHKNKPFSCLTCGKYFASKAGLNIHNHVHTEDYMLSCRYCYKTFRFQEDKQQHEDTHQGEEFKYCCSDCPKRFADHVSREAHRKTHWEHGRFICKICDKIFSKVNRLQRHEMVHTGLKPYMCELCDRSFNQAGHLKSHMRVHTGERPFKCHECGLCFNHNVSLKNHVQRKHRSASDGDDGYREEVWDDLITGTQSDG